VFLISSQRRFIGFRLKSRIKKDRVKNLARIRLCQTVCRVLIIHFTVTPKCFLEACPQIPPSDRQNAGRTKICQENLPSPL